jgi:transposase
MNPHTMNSDEDRLEIFRALRSQIRGSTEVLLVGIDVAKQRHHAFFGTPAGETLRKRFVFGNHRAGFEALVGLAGDLQRQHELPQRVFGLEPTGVYHKPLLEFLIGEGEQAVLVSNVAVARNRELLDGRWDKNDVNDPANVADLVGQARCLFADHPTAELRELRSFVRARARLKKQEHAVRLRIRNHLIAQYFPELEAAYAKGGGANDAVVLRIVEQCFDPAEIAQMSCDGFWAQIAEPGWNPRHEARVRRVWQAAAQSIGCPLDAAVRWEAPRLVHRLEALRDDLRELEHRMHQLAQRLPGYPSVISIPGMGPVLTALLLAGIGDPYRFAHSRQVLRLAGLDLCARRSGTSSDRAVPRISKQGKASLRFALVHAAMVAARSDPALRGYFSRLVAGRTHERGIRRKMYVKLAAKLLVIAWTLMRRGDIFRPDRFLE